MSAYSEYKELIEKVRILLELHGLEAQKFYYNKRSMKIRDLTSTKGDLHGECLVVARELMRHSDISQVNVVNRLKVVSASRALAFGEKEHLVSITVHFRSRT